MHREKLGSQLEGRPPGHLCGCLDGVHISRFVSPKHHKRLVFSGATSMELMDEQEALQLCTGLCTVIHSRGMEIYEQGEG